MFADNFLFSNLLLANDNLPTFGSESGLNLAVCDLRRNYYDFGGAKLTSEILRHFTLFLVICSLILPLLIDYLETPIKRTELNLTEH